MLSDASCVFCKIILGKIPSIKIAEDNLCIAFMDIAPLSRGHCLVVPKSHYSKLHETPPEVMDSLGKMLLKVTKAMKENDYNVLQNNGPLAHQAVSHVHFHIIPAPPGVTGGAGLKLANVWKPQEVSQAEMEAEAESIRSHMG